MRGIARELAALEACVARVGKAVVLVQSCFPAQQSFVLDRSRLRAAGCGRRAGKTHGIAVFLLVGMLVAPGSLSLYIAITRSSAKRIMWRTLIAINLEFRLGGSFKLGELQFDLPGGSTLQLAGCPDASHIDTFRGPPYRRAAIDEGASFPGYLRALVDEVLIPATADLQGDVAIVGSPGVAPVGYLYEATEGVCPGWSGAHHWTMLDNPHIPHASEEIDALCKRRGWSKDHPTLQREYLGRWVADASMLVYAGFRDVLVRDDAPLREQGPWYYVLGIDFGWSETRETLVYSLLCYSMRSPTVWVLKTWGASVGSEEDVKNGVAARRVAATIKDIPQELEAIVGDPGDLGSEYIKQLRERFAIPIEPAEKQNKRGFIELINGDMTAGHLLFCREGTEHLVDEMRILPWRDEHRTEEKPRVPNHHCDSALYAWRRCKAYAFQADAPEEPKPGSLEHYKEYEKSIEDSRIRMIRSQKRRGIQL